MELLTSHFLLTVFAGIFIKHRNRCQPNIIRFGFLFYYFALVPIMNGFIGFNISTYCAVFFFITVCSISAINSLCCVLVLTCRAILYIPECLKPGHYSSLIACSKMPPHRALGNRPTSCFIFVARVAAVEYSVLIIGEQNCMTVSLSSLFAVGKFWIKYNDTFSVVCEILHKKICFFRKVIR